MSPHFFLQVQLNEWFESLIANPSGVRSLADLIKFNEDNPELETPPPVSVSIHVCLLHTGHFMSN